MDLVWLWRAGLIGWKQSEFQTYRIYAMLDAVRKSMPMVKFADGNKIASFTQYSRQASSLWGDNQKQATLAEQWADAFDKYKRAGMVRGE